MATLWSSARPHPHSARRHALYRPAAAHNYQLSLIAKPRGPHDYFSQADYFWPNPADPDGKYIDRDGQSNPENFNDHRKTMIALSIQMPALTAAWFADA